MLQWPTNLLLIILQITSTVFNELGALSQYQIIIVGNNELFK